MSKHSFSDRLLSICLSPPEPHGQFQQNFGWRVFKNKVFTNEGPFNTQHGDNDLLSFN